MSHVILAFILRIWQVESSCKWLDSDAIFGRVMFWRSTVWWVQLCLELRGTFLLTNMFYHQESRITYKLVTRSVSDTMKD